MAKENKKPKEFVPPTVSTSEGKFTLDRETILSDIYLKTLISEDELTRKRLYDATEEAARAQQVVTAFKKAYDTTHKKAVAQAKKAAMTLGNNYAGNYTNFFTNEEHHAGYKEFKCGYWDASRDGISYIEYFGKSSREIFACRTAVYISHYIIPADQPEKRYFEVRFISQSGKWSTIVIKSRSELLNARNIIALLDGGVQSDSTMASALVKYLGDFLHLNGGEIPTIIGTPTLGYYRNANGHMMLLPYDDNTDFFSTADSSFEDLRKAITIHGDESPWIVSNNFQKIYDNQDNQFTSIKDVRKSGRVEPLLIMAAAVASLLVEPLDMLPFIFHLWGESGCGKTVCLLLAASIYANPSKKSGYISDFQGTMVAMETRADFLKCFPLCLDDTANSSRFIDLQELIYYLTSGHGRDRSTKKLGKERTHTWNNTIITTGEKPLTDTGMRGGSFNRVLQYHCKPGTIFKHPNRLVRTLTESYGWVGKFLSMLFSSLYENREGLDILRDKHIAYTEAIQTRAIERAHGNNNDLAEKQADSAALLLLADEFLQQYFQDGIKLTIDDVLDCTTDNRQLNEEYRAYNRLKDYIIQEPYRLYHTTKSFTTNDNDEDDIKHNKQVKSPIGRLEVKFDKNKIDETIYLIPSSLTELLSNWGLSSEKSFIAWAKQKNLLLCNRGKGDRFYTWICPDDKKRKNNYAIKLVENPDLDIIPHPEGNLCQ